MALQEESGVGGRNAPERVEIHTGRVSVPIDIVSLDYVLSWVFDSRRTEWEVMVTPNLHHLRIARNSERIGERYSRATLSSADGWPVAWLASRAGGRRVERVVGADLFQRLIAIPAEGTPLVIVGGTQGSELEELLVQCRRLGWHVGNEPAPRAELTNPQARSELVARIGRAGAGGVVVIGIGAPRQEELAAEIAEIPGAGAILCLGMSINFSSGVARRAPLALQSLRLEWAYRAISEPRRLLGRYAKDFLVLPPLLRQNPRRRPR